jgi:hypothetical protein
MSVSCERFVLSGKVLCDDLIISLEETYRLLCAAVRDL